MTVYLINKETKEITNEYNNVVEYTEQYVIYQAGKGKGKIYANENEYFSIYTPK